MLDYLRVAMQLPLTTMAGMADVLVASLREVERAVASGFPTSSTRPDHPLDSSGQRAGTFGHEPDRHAHDHIANTSQPEGLRQDFLTPTTHESTGQPPPDPNRSSSFHGGADGAADRSSPVPRPLSSSDPTRSSLSTYQTEILQMNHESGESYYDEGRFEEGCETDEFFRDRDYIKAYEYTTLFVAENADAVLANEKTTTRDDTSEHGRIDVHRREILELLEAIGTGNGVEPEQLPEVWQEQLPDFLVEDNGKIYWAEGDEYQEIFDDRDAYIKVSIKKLSRHLIRARSDDRRQSNATESIAKTLSRIEQHGLKTREY